MASPTATAERHAAANQRIDAAMRRLANNVDGLTVPRPVRASDEPAVRAANEADRVAAFLEQLADNVDGGAGGNAAPLGTIRDGYVHNEAIKQQQQRQQSQPASPAAATDENAGTGDGGEPTFAGHPLSFFDGKSDEDILATEGVGEATLAKIKDARKGK